MTKHTLTPIVPTDHPQHHMTWTPTEIKWITAYAERAVDEAVTALHNKWLMAQVTSSVGVEPVPVEKTCLVYMGVGKMSYAPGGGPAEYGDSIKCRQCRGSGTTIEEQARPGAQDDIRGRTYDTHFDMFDVRPGTPLTRMEDFRQKVSEELLAGHALGVSDDRLLNLTDEQIDRFFKKSPFIVRRVQDRTYWEIVEMTNPDFRDVICDPDHVVHVGFFETYEAAYDVRRRMSARWAIKSLLQNAGDNS